MQKLNILSEDYSTIIFGWNKIDTADEYMLEGITDIFTYEPITKIKKCSYVYKKNQKYIGYRICYLAKQGKNSYIVDTTNIAKPEKNTDKLDKIAIIPVKSTNREISLSFRSEELFDWYRLYDDKGNMIAETQDWIVLGNYFGKYYV